MFPAHTVNVAEQVGGGKIVHTTKGRFTLYGTARHDTTRQEPACIHMYWQLTDTRADRLLFELSNKECVFEFNLFLTVV